MVSSSNRTLLVAALFRLTTVDTKTRPFHEQEKAKIKALPSKLHRRSGSSPSQPLCRLHRGIRERVLVSIRRRIAHELTTIDLLKTAYERMLPASKNSAEMFLRTGLLKDVMDELLHIYEYALSLEDFGSMSGGQRPSRNTYVGECDGCFLAAVGGDAKALKALATCIVLRRRSKLRRWVRAWLRLHPAAVQEEVGRDRHYHGGLIRDWINDIDAIMAPFEHQANLSARVQNWIPDPAAAQDPDQEPSTRWPSVSSSYVPVNGGQYRRPPIITSPIHVVQQAKGAAAHVRAQAADQDFSTYSTSASEETSGDADDDDSDSNYSGRRSPTDTRPPPLRQQRTTVPRPVNDNRLSMYSLSAAGEARFGRQGSAVIHSVSSFLEALEQDAAHDRERGDGDGNGDGNGAEAGGDGNAGESQARTRTRKKDRLNRKFGGRSLRYGEH